MPLISESLEIIINKIAVKKNIQNAKIITDWYFIAGETLAKNSLPWKISHSKYDEKATLFIYVRDSSAALEISYMEQVILERITTYFGNNSITRIKTQQNAKIFSNVRDDKKIETKSLLSEEEKSKITEELKYIENDELRQALVNMAISMRLKNNKENR